MQQLAGVWAMSCPSAGARGSAPEPICHHITPCLLPAPGALEPCRDSDPSISNVLCWLRTASSLPCAPAAKPGRCHQCHCPLSRTVPGHLPGPGMLWLLRAVRKTLRGQQELSQTSHSSCNAQSWRLEAKKHPTN